MNTDNKDAYIAILGAAIRKGWPETHIKDLLIDGAILGVLPGDRIIADGEPFGWVLRDKGTHIVGASWPLYNNTIRACNNGWEMYGAKNYLYYWWDGTELISVTHPTAILERMSEWQSKNADKLTDKQVF